MKQHILRKISSMTAYPLSTSLRQLGHSVGLSVGLLLSLMPLLQGCAGATQATRLQYDFGALPDVLQHQQPLSPLATSAPAFSISVADVSAPLVLDSTAMWYRLAYDNEQQLRAYAQHRWSMSPAQLLTYRLKSRMAAAGGSVLAVTDGVADLPVLKIDLDEFSQIFSTPARSHAQITLRASVTKRNKLLAQRYFTFNIDADSADAPAGAKAMQRSADASISAILVWLQSIPATTRQ